MNRPDSADIQRAIQLHSAGQLDQAERGYRDILARFPDEPNCTHMLGMLLHHRGRNTEAGPLLERSIELAKRVPDFQYNYGLFCRATGKLDLAERHFRRAVMLNPALAQAHDMLGVVLEQQGKSAEAATSYAAACSANPGFVEAHLHLGLLHCRQERYDEAVKRLRHVVSLRPQLAAAHIGLCAALGRLHGRGPGLDESLRHGQTAVQLAPNDTDAHCVLACALGIRGHLDAALSHLRASLQLQPRNVDAMVNMAWLLDQQQRFDDAAQLCRQAIAISPQHVAAWSQLSHSLHQMRQIDESVQAALTASRLAPQHVGARINLATGYLEQGRASEAIASFRSALELRPDDAEARSNLLLALHYDPEIAPAALFQEHRLFETSCGRSITPLRRRNEHDRSPDRPLRIGYVSPYFRRHAVATFLEPILRSHDRSACVVSCYSDVRVPDEVTHRLQGHAQHWHNTANLSDDELANLVQNNGEDILVDLTGHIAGGRLPAFARKPAPILVSYLGYINTTGLTAIDYRLTDSIADPEGTDSLYTEKLFRLPRFFCYEPPRDAPAVGPLPAHANGYVTFGSFNHPAKFNQRVIELWARLLNEVPGSRLILNADAPGDGERRLTELLLSFQLPRERFEFVYRRPWGEYLNAYNRIDIALDPFPFGGHTTTCDALWMGVPAITRAGSTYMGRLTAATLTPLGMRDLIAADPDEYVRIATTLAANVPGLAEIRVSLRERVRSGFTDGKAFTSQLENAYRQMWTTWCGLARQ